VTDKQPVLTSALPYLEFCTALHKALVLLFASLSYVPQSDQTYAVGTLLRIVKEITAKVLIFRYVLKKNISDFKLLIRIFQH
jgi:hypothetical protein